MRLHGPPFSVSLQNEVISSNTGDTNHTGIGTVLITT